MANSSIIRRTANNTAGRITELEYINGGTWIAPVHSYWVYTSSKQTNINVASLIEGYRKNPGTDFTTVAESIKLELSDIPPITRITPDYIQIFNSADTIRNQLIELFSDKLLAKTHNSQEINYSRFFVKSRPTESITVMNSNNENFKFTRPSNISSPIGSLIIIDDCINEGRTVRYFLDALHANGLLSVGTRIEIYAIYAFQVLNNKFKTFNLSRMKEFQKNEQSLNDRHTTRLLIENRDRSAIIIGAPHHAPGGVQTLPCIEHPDSDENTGLLAHRLAELTQYNSIIACNYTIDPNKHLDSDYSKQIIAWRPRYLIEIHGHGARIIDDCVFRSKPYHRSDANLTSYSAVKFTTIPEETLPLIPLESLPVRPCLVATVVNILKKVQADIPA